MKQINGYYIGDHAPYGYVKSKEDKHKLVVDEEAADVVRMIFEWKAEGNSNVSICRKLFDLNIMPPSRYKYDKGIVKDKRYANLIYWTDSTIAVILKNETYIGNMPQGKTKSHFCDGKRIEKIPQKNWIVVEGTHEAIVSRELFDKVQKVIADYQEKHKNVFEGQRKAKKSEQALKGKVVCGECGHRCRRHKGKSNGKYNYVCAVHHKFPDQCQYTSIKEDELKSIVLQAIKSQLMVLSDLERTLSEVIKSPKSKQKMIELSKNIINSLANISYIKTRRVKLTADYAKQIVDDEEYLQIKTGFDDQLRQEAETLEVLNKERENFNKLMSAEKWIAELKRYSKAKKLTAEMADIFVDKVLIFPEKRLNISWKHTDSVAEIVSLVEGGDKYAI